MRTAEDIVKEKEFYELTEADRILLKGIAENETEFNELKYLLQESATFFSQRKVNASDEMRAHIMEKLYPPTATAPVSWYQSIWIFLFPPNKSFYQYPAFQLATVLVLLLAVSTLLRNPLKKQDLAQNNSLQKVELEGSKGHHQIEEKEDDVSEESKVVEDLAEDNTQIIDPPSPIVVNEKTSEEELLVINDEKAYAKIEKTEVESQFTAIADTEDDKYVSAPTQSNAVQEIGKLDIELSDNVRREDANTKDLDIVEISAAKEKKEVRMLAETESKAAGVQIFRDKAKVNYLNVLEINNLKDLFFEVK